MKTYDEVYICYFFFQYAVYWENPDVIQQKNGDYILELDLKISCLQKYMPTLFRKHETSYYVKWYYSYV